MHFISIKSILSDHLSYVTIFHSSIGRSDKTDLTVINFKKVKDTSSHKVS